MSGAPLYEFADKINQIMPVIFKEFARHQQNELYKGKITLPQFMVLELLHRVQEMKMTGLAKFMHVSTAAMTGVVDRLVRDSYVERVNDAKDRRIIRVKLTSRGKDLVEKISGQRRRMVINIFGKIPESDRREYLRILMRVKDILTKKQAQPL